MSRQTNRHLPALGFRAVPVIGRHRVLEATPPMPRKRHPELYELLYLHSGLQFRACDGESRAISGGQGYLVRPGLWHGTGIVPLGKGLAYWLHLRRLSGKRLFGLPGDETRHVFAALDAQPGAWLQPAIPCRETFETILRLARPQAGVADRLAIRRALLTIVAAFVEARPIAAGEPDRLPQALTAAMADPAAYADPQAVAELAGLSLSRLRARVKDLTGMPLGDWLLQQRLRRAMARLINEPTRSITDIALDLGFSSSQYFATVFKRHAACSPRAFRRLVETTAGRRRLVRLGLVAA